MPNTKGRVLGAGYENDPIKEFASSFSRTVSNIVTEGGYDYFSETGKALRDTGVKQTLKNFFLSESYDPSDPYMTPSEVEVHNENMTQLFENDVKAMQESCNTASFNALVGMTLPMHKNILMNMVWDKGGIPKKIADSEKVVRTMEVRQLVRPDGSVIDMFLQQNEMTEALRSANPWIDVELNCGEAGETEIVSNYLNGSEIIDHIDIETHISAVKIEKVFYKAGEYIPGDDGFYPTNITADTPKATADKEIDTWFKVNLKFGPGYGDVKRQLMRPVRLTVNKQITVSPATEGGTATTKVEAVDIDDVISANLQNDRFMIQSMKGQVSAVKVACKLDASSRTINTCSVKWDEITDIVEIGTDEGISTTVSPEEIKDISVLYNVNQVTKVMSLMKTALGNRKDDEIKFKMKDSYDRLMPNQKFYGVFDFAPREGYMLDHIEHRAKTFWDFFDTYVTHMYRVLNDPNMTVSVFGEPDIVRKITPKTYTYQAPSNIGPVELDFAKTVCTSDKRVYNFIGSDKLRDDYEMVITLCPRNSNRIVYIIYDYQFYISNEIRNNSNPALPQITAFERWLFDEYQPVQGRIKIANPLGIREDDKSETMWSF